MLTISTTIKNNVVKIQGHAWLQMLHIYQNYTFLITVMAILLLKKLKYHSQNAKNRRSGEKSNHIYETYKNTVIPHGLRIYTKVYDMERATMCAYSHSDHALPHWKCALRCCAKCVSIYLPDLEADNQYPDTSPSIGFHIYHLITRCTNMVGFC